MLLDEGAARSWACSLSTHAEPLLCRPHLQRADIVALLDEWAARFFEGGPASGPLGGGAAGLGQ